MSDEIRIETSDPDVARAEIERTRQRMSGTLDEIELLIAGKKKRLREQLDLGARVRAKPLHAAGAVLAAGLLLGLLTGGRRRGYGSGDPAAVARAVAWEKRARRLLEIARAQEEEVDRLRGDRGLSFRPSDSVAEGDYDDELDDDLWDSSIASYGEDDFDEDDDDYGFDTAEELDDDEDPDWDEDGDDDVGSGLSALKEAFVERMKELVAEGTSTLADSLQSRR